MDSARGDALELDLAAIARLKRDHALPTPITVRNLITMALFAVFWEGLGRGQLMTPEQMMRAMVKLVKGKPNGNEHREALSDERRLELMLEAIQHGHTMSARIYTDYVRNPDPRVKLRARGRPRSIDEEQRELLLQDGLSHAQKAKLLGLPTKTAEERLRAKDVVRKRIALVKDRDND